MIDFLNKVTIFKDLPETELNSIERFSRIRVCKKDEVIFNENDIGKVIYIVRSGKFRLFMGNQKITDFHALDVFGELALINENIRSGKVVAIEDGELIEIAGYDLVNNDELDPRTSLNIIRELARRVTAYLRPQKYVKTQELLQMGENDHVEFKSSLRFNYFTKKFGKEIEHAALKSIAAFLNSKGGTLLIGVNDNGEVIGIEEDKFENDDKTLLHLTKLISDRMSSNHNSFLKASIEQVEGKKVLRIDVQPSTLPAYLTNNNDEYLYIRTGPATTELKASEIFLYVYNRFFTELAKRDKSSS